MKQQFFIIFLTLLSTVLSAQKVDFRQKAKNDSLAKENVENIIIAAKENVESGKFLNAAPSEMRINSSLLNRTIRSFSPFEPRNFEIANDVHYLPQNTRIPPIGIQKLAEIQIYKSK